MRRRLISTVTSWAIRLLGVDRAGRLPMPAIRRDINERKFFLAAAGWSDPGPFWTRRRGRCPP